MTKTFMAVALGTLVTVVPGCAPISATRAQTSTVVLPANNFLTLASLNLPAGNYVFLGQVDGRPYNSTPANVGIGCQIWSNTSGSPIGWGEATLLSYYFQLSPIASVAFPSGGRVWIQCRTDDAATVIIDDSVLIAVRVHTIN